MAEVNLHSWSEISQASEGLQLNSTATTWENILSRLARIESRLIEQERRAASTLPPLRPEPDPPDGPPQWWTSTFSLPDAPQPLHNLPEQHIQCEFLAYDQQPTTAWPLHTTLRQLTCRDQPTQRQPPGFQQYDQLLAHQLSCWEPPLTATVAANQPYQSYQPPPLLSRSDRRPQQSSPALPNAAFEPPLYAASDTYASFSYVLRKNSSWDVLESTQKENFMVDCDRVEEGLDDSTEKNDIDANLEAGEDDAAEERKTIDEEKSNVVIKDESGHACVEEDDVPPKPLKCFPDYDDHTLVSVELCNSMEHLSEGNDRIEGNGDFEENRKGISTMDDCNVIDDMGDSSCVEVGINNYIASYLAFSYLMVQANDGSCSIICDGENNMFECFLNVKPQGAIVGVKIFHNGSQKLYSDDKDMEVSTSMISVLGRLLNLEFLSTADVCTLRQCCANPELMHTFDPGGDISLRLLFMTLFVVSWFPP